MAKTKSKVSKWIAGLTTTRTIRKGTLRTLVSTPAGQILLAELLILIGGAIATAVNSDTKSGRALRVAVNEGLHELRGGKTDKYRKGNIGQHFGEGLVKGIEAFRQSMRTGSAEPELKDVEPIGHGIAKRS